MTVWQDETLVSCVIRAIRVQDNDIIKDGVRERLRLAALHSYELLDTGFEPEYDAIVTAAARRFRVPISLLSLIDGQRQWFKARHGLAIRETDRSLAFCVHVVADCAPLVVADATRDPRFATNPMVTGAPRVRFYAGVPLMTPLARCLGTLNVIDTLPRTSWSDAETAALARMGDEVMALLERRRGAVVRNRALADRPAGAIGR